MRSSHREPLIDLLRATQSFREEEIDVAVELFDDACADATRAASTGMGPDSTGNSAYRLIGLFGEDNAGVAAEENGSLIGYACYGPTPATHGTYDLYWIAVHPSAQGTGGGRMLLGAVEDRVIADGGRMIIVETSSRSDYEGTRRFYDRRGYREGARVRDFYAPHDDRVIFARRFPPKPVAGGASQQ